MLKFSGRVKYDKFIAHLGKQAANFLMHFELLTCVQRTKKTVNCDTNYLKQNFFMYGIPGSGYLLMRLFFFYKSIPCTHLCGEINLHIGTRSWYR